MGHSKMQVVFEGPPRFHGIGGPPSARANSQQLHTRRRGKSKNLAPKRTPCPLYLHHCVALRKKATIPDALSRAPINDPGPDDEAANSDVKASSHQTIITWIAGIYSNENVDPPAMDESAALPDLPDPLIEEIRAIYGPEWR
jgi:hypothetical protein